MPRPGVNRQRRGLRFLEERHTHAQTDRYRLVHLPASPQGPEADELHDHQTTRWNLETLAMKHPDLVEVLKLRFSDLERVAPKE
ncbi:MAG: hypothetical protein R3C02_25910 [Planctomycetaceae bacterium]